MLFRFALACLLPLLAVAAAAAQTTPPAASPPGEDKGVGTRLLETGAAMVQGDAPVDALDVHLVGFHPMKDDPSHQIEAHHFCRQVNEDFMQCALFDGNSATANLTGVEYIVSERLFLTLPREERRFWHPHNFEILSGQLIAPGVPEPAEHALMRGKMNSYGKTWHTWDTAQGADGDLALPLGPPRLAWSFNRLGEAQAELVAARDRRLGVSTEATREARQDLVPLAKPQVGVDALKDRYAGPTQAIPGVVDARAR
ncbi:MAG: OBAP family protein [Geminicoccaceae bacterium]